MLGKSFPIPRSEDFMRQHSPIPLPPEELSICFGGGDYIQGGQMLLDHLIRHAGLKPGDRVLDVGSGVGRGAFALASYLSAEGSYLGFDTYPFGIDWCRDNITPIRPNFRFELVDVYSGVYNPFSVVKASELRFPCDDASFDVVVLNSVFTHMLPEDMAHYLEEIARVLAAGGRMFATFYLMNADARSHMAKGNANPNFTHSYSGFHVADPTSMEDAVAYKEELVHNLLRRNGLDLETVLYGRWCGRPVGENGQDMLVARRGAKH